MTIEETTESGTQNKRGPTIGEAGRNIGEGKNEPLAEGKTTRAIEQVTARAPSQLWLWMAGAAIAGSLGLYVSGRRQAGIFVGLWPLTFLVMGNYNKIVKVIGSSAQDRQDGQ